MGRDDPRVSERAGGYRVGDLSVVDTDVFGWAVCHGPNRDFVQADGGPSGFAIGFPDPDSAVDFALDAAFGGGEAEGND